VLPGGGALAYAAVAKKAGFPCRYQDTNIMTGQLNPLLQQRVVEISGRYGVGTDAAYALLDALFQNGGSMAQFNHPDLGGSGQWMQGGMTMVGDMFNNGLKAKVDGLCSELSTLLPLLPRTSGPIVGGSFQSQSQGDGRSMQWGNQQTQGGSFQMQGGGEPWPDLGPADLVGGQNDLRYAYYAAARRLVMSEGGRIRTYDTGDHHLQGVSQQQQNGVATLSFSTPYGPVFLSSFPLVEEGARAPTPAPAPTHAPAAFAPAATPGQVGAVPEAAELAGTSWLFAPGEGIASAPLTLAADGVIAGAASRQYRYWAKEGEALRFFSEDGLPSAHFDGAERDGAGTLCALSSSADAQAVLRRPAAGGDTAPTTETALTVSIPLTGGEWLLLPAGGGAPSRLQLLPDGRVEGGQANAARWRVSDGILCFLHGSGRPTIRFDRLCHQDHQWELSGTVIGQGGSSCSLKRV
jgi:hypothetical protein